MNRKYYSRLERVETQKNRSRAVIFVTATIGVVILFFFVGLPGLSKLAGLIFNLRGSSAIEVKDTTAPPPPILYSLPSATNQKQLEVKGSSEPGALIKLTVNNQDYEATSNSSGSFTSTITLVEGENLIKAKATDTAGNESSASNVLVITLSSKNPTLDITAPNDGDTIFGQGGKVEIKGTTDSPNRITVNDKVVIVSSSGAFVYTLSLTAGTNDIKVKAIDASGNITEKALTVTYNP